LSLTLLQKHPDGLELGLQHLAGLPSLHESLRALPPAGPKPARVTLPRLQLCRVDDL
jgi:hypothetical protein